MNLTELWLLLTRWRAKRHPRGMSSMPAVSPEDKRGVDRPVTTRAEDRLDRTAFAEMLARELTRVPARHGFAMAVTGEWGIGKTSVINMAIEAVMETDDGQVVVQFNPWYFSGTEQLLARFFYELSAQLGVNRRGTRIAEVASRLGRVGDALRPLGPVPMVGNVASAVALAGDVSRGTTTSLLRRQPSIIEQMQLLRQELSQLDRRIMVVVDDIDRLRLEEIREVVRVVKLASDLPGLVFLLAYDQLRVESALAIEGEDGKAYLAKIVQVSHNVPEPSQQRLFSLFLSDLEDLLADYEHEPFVQEDFDNIFHLGMRSLFSSIRDVKRYINSLPGTLLRVGNEIAIADLLAIESVRVFLPEAYQRLNEGREILSAPAPGPGLQRYESERDAGKEAVTAVLDAAGEHRQAMQELLRRLVPQTRYYLDNISYGSEWLKQWRRDRRLAHPSLLQLYFGGSLPSAELPADHVDEIVASLTDAGLLTQLLAHLDADQLEHLLERLEAYEDEFNSEMARESLPVLYTALGRMRTEARGMLDLRTPDVAVMRIAYRVFKRISADERDAVIRDVFRALPDLRTRYELLHVLIRDRADESLVSQELLDELHDAFRTEAFALSFEDLLSQTQGLRILLQALEGGDNLAKIQELRTAVHDSDEALLALLVSALSEARSQTITDVHVRRRPQLAWKVLCDLVGPELLKQRVVAIAGASDHEGQTETAVALAMQYVEGKNPEDPFDD